MVDSVSWFVPWLWWSCIYAGPSNAGLSSLSLELFVDLLIMSVCWGTPYWYPWQELTDRRTSYVLSEYCSDSKYLQYSRRISMSSLPVSNLNRLCQHPTWGRATPMHQAKYPLLTYLFFPSALWQDKKINNLWNPINVLSFIINLARRASNESIKLNL